MIALCQWAAVAAIRRPQVSAPMSSSGLVILQAGLEAQVDRKHCDSESNSPPSCENMWGIRLFVAVFRVRTNDTPWLSVLSGEFVVIGHLRWQAGGTIFLE